MYMCTTQLGTTRGMNSGMMKANLLHLKFPLVVRENEGDQLFAIEISSA